MQKVPITAYGHRRLQQQLHRLKTLDRPRIISAIAEARAHGDISENAEYEAAREEQAFAEAKINEIESLLARAEVIDPAAIRSEIAVFGCTVQLLNTATDEPAVYSVVGDPEAVPEKGLIGLSTPIARAILGREVGDEIRVRAPGGDLEYEITEIRYAEIRFED